MAIGSFLQVEPGEGKQATQDSPERKGPRQGPVPSAAPFLMRPSTRVFLSQRLTPCPWILSCQGAARPFGGLVLTHAFPAETRPEIGLSVSPRVATWAARRAQLPMSSLPSPVTGKTEPGHPPLSPSVIGPTAPPAEAPLAASRALPVALLSPESYPLCSCHHFQLLSKPGGGWATLVRTCPAPAPLAATCRLPRPLPPLAPLLQDLPGLPCRERPLLLLNSPPHLAQPPHLGPTSACCPHLAPPSANLLWGLGLKCHQM